jgi:Restriction endonuclease
MGVPSTQIMSVWIKDGANNTEWAPLEEVAFTVLRAKLTKHSDEEISELIEEKLSYIAEALRNDAAELHADGMPARFAIDEEASPYFKAFPTDTALLEKLRRIDPFKVEDLCAAILAKLGGVARATERTGDGGVDFVATDLDIMPSGFGIPAVCRATVIGQTKRYKETNVIKETSLREFVGAGVWKRHRLRLDSGISPLAPVILAYWTTSNFEPNAKRYAREMGLWYMDGHTLAAYIDKLELSEFVFGLPDEVPLEVVGGQPPSASTVMEG